MMKRALFAVCAALCVLTAAETSAKETVQPAEKQRPTAEQFAEKRTQHLVRFLGLDEKQAQYIRKEQLRLAEQREEMFRLRAAYAEKMKSLLTEEQYAAWRHMRMARCPHHPGGPTAHVHRYAACPCRMPAHRHECIAPVSDSLCPGGPTSVRGAHPHRRTCCGR